MGFDGPRLVVERAWLRKRDPYNVVVSDLKLDILVNSARECARFGNFIHLSGLV